VAALAERTPAVRLATASVVGTMLEYYDFAVYNTLAALVFNRLFFPSFDPLSGTILALSTSPWVTCRARSAAWFSAISATASAGASCSSPRCS
jgi:hypothetical protein